ncbi:MAG: TRAP transporter TatT component family protein [Myxococcota bacterium]
MKTTLVALAGTLILTAGCSAGRKAAWEQEQDTGTKVQAAQGETPEAHIAAGDEAWKSRGDQKSLEAAIAAWEKALALKADDAATWAKLARAYYFLADAHVRKQGDKSDAYLATFEKGVAAGERAMAAANAQFKEAVTAGKRVEEAAALLGDESIEAAYWYASSLGKWARAKGFATTLGNKDKIRSVMNRILELDPEGKFFHAAVHRYFGAFYGVAPGFAGGDMDKSKEYFEKSLALAPGYIGTKVLFADVYAVKKQDKALFEKLLDEVMQAPDDVIPGLEPETKNEKEKAAELKTKAAELF